MALPLARAAVEDLATSAQTKDVRAKEALFTLGEVALLLGLDEESRKALEQACQEPVTEPQRCDLFLADLDLRDAIQLTHELEWNQALIALYDDPPAGVEQDSANAEQRTALEQELATQQENLEKTLNRARGRYTYARKRAKTMSPPDAETFGRAVSGLGLLALLAGEREQRARSLQEQALASMEASFGANDPRLIPILRSLWGTRLAEGEEDRQILPILERALAIALNRLGPEHPYTADVYGDLSAVYLRLGHNDSAVEAVEARLTFLEKIPGFDPLWGEYQKAGELFNSSGEADRALGYLLRAAQLSATRYGRNSKKAADDLIALAEISFLERDSLSEFLWRASLAPDQRVVDEENPGFAQILDKLAGAYEEAGRKEQARDIRRRRVALPNGTVLPPEAASLLAETESEFGLEMAQRLVDLAFTMSLRHQDEWAAMKLYERAAEIRKKVAGIDSLDTSQSIAMLAFKLEKIGRYDEGLAVYERYIDRLEQQQPRDHSNASIIYRGFADFLSERGESADATYYRHRAEEETQLALSSDDGSEEESRAVGVSESAADILGLREEATDADIIAERSRLRPLIPSLPEEARELVREATTSTRYIDARRLSEIFNQISKDGGRDLQRLILWAALDIRRRLTLRNPTSEALLLSKLTVTYRDHGNLPLAARLAKEAVELLVQDQAVGGPEIDEIATILIDIYRRQERESEAAPILDRILTLQRQTLGAGHPATVPLSVLRAGLAAEEGTATGSLAVLEAAVETAMATPEGLANLGRGPQQLIDLLRMTLAEIAVAEDEHRAESLLRRALSRQRRALEKGHPAISESALLLAGLLRRTHRDTEAGEMVQLALEALEHPTIRSLRTILLFLTLERLASGSEAIMKARQEIPKALKALNLKERQLGPNHPELEEPLAELSNLYLTSHQFEAATEIDLRLTHLDQKLFGDPVEADQMTVDQRLFQRMNAVFSQRLCEPWSEAGEYLLPRRRCLKRLWKLAVARAEAQRMEVAAQLALVAGFEQQVRVRRTFRADALAYLDVEAAYLSMSPPNAREIVATGFELVDFARSDPAGEATERLAERYSATDSASPELIRRWQEARQRHQQAQRRRTRAVGSGAGKQELQRLAAEVEERRSESDQLSAELMAVAPDFVPAARASLPAHDIQESLAADEALLAYFLGSDRGYLWVMRKNSLEVLGLDLKLVEVDEQIRTVRSNLEASLRPQPFAASTAHALYQGLFAPAIPFLEDVHRLYVVPDGPLHLLPFVALVRDPPEAAFWSPEARWKPSWLAEGEFSITILPEPASLTLLRGARPSHRAEKSFIGFGNPVLSGGNRGLEPLPETEHEIVRMAEALGADEAEILTGSRMTEAAIKTAILTDYRVLAFATHGRNDVPALVTTMSAGRQNDDGLLTADEIARLHLQAELVVLSACKTAAPTGATDEDALAGLVRAFLFAGARSVIATRLPVISNAAGVLTARTLENARDDPRLDWAGALQQAMVEMARGDLDTSYRHPRYWAPFLVVGTGDRLVQEDR